MGHEIVYELKMLDALKARVAADIRPVSDQCAVVIGAHIE